MKANQKTQLIEIFQEMKICVAMVGDGSNDIGALRKADIGLSLSTSEASISASFTS
jgi:P-type E1-E2 ATPase